MREIERQATEAWLATPCEVIGGPEATEARRAVAAHDFMVVKVSQQPQANDQVGVAGTNAQQARGRPEKRRRTNHMGGNGNGRR